MNVHKAEEDYVRYSDLSRTQIDYSLMVELISKIVKTTAIDQHILVFLPGFASIESVSKKLEMKDLKQIKIIVLHSSVDSCAPNKKVKRSAEDDAFNSDSEEERKIILATNIAETSVTIPGIVHVIDTGLSKTRTYNPVKDCSQFCVSVISKASATQRKGRAGRTRPGCCYRLYTKEAFEQMQQNAVPEIQRVPLADTCLTIKSIVNNMSIDQFLTGMITPPHTQNVRHSIAYLQQIGALDAFENVTALGNVALALPVDVKYVRALISSITLRCFEPVAIIVSMLSSPPPFKLGAEANEKLFEFQNGSVSDYHTTWKIYREFIDEYEKYRFCEENCLSYSVMQTAHGIFALLKNRFKSLNFILTMSAGEYLCVNSNQSRWDLVHACLASTFHQHLCICVADQFHDLGFNRNVATHHQSVVHRRTYRANSIAVYCDKSAGPKCEIIQNVAIVSPYAVILMCGQGLQISYDNGTGSIQFGNILKLKVIHSTFERLMNVRALLNSMMEEAIAAPHIFRMDDAEGQRMGRILEGIMKL